MCFLFHNDIIIAKFTGLGNKKIRKILYGKMKEKLAIFLVSQYNKLIYSDYFDKGFLMCI